MVRYAAFYLMGSAALALVGGTSSLASDKTDIRPIAEYEPTRSVLISEQLLENQYDRGQFVQAVLDQNVNLLIAVNPDHRKKDAFNFLGLEPRHLQKVKVLKLRHASQWIRDYGPLFSKFGHSLQIADFRWGNDDKKEDEDFRAAFGRLSKTQVVKIDHELDGGNFLSDGTYCVTSRQKVSNELINRESFDQLGCKKTIVLENPPHPHVDMWLKITGPGRVLVSGISTTTRKIIESYYGGHIPSDLVWLSDRLDAMASVLSKYFKVDRIPLPMPFRNVFRSYANALLVNGLAIVPRYKVWGWGRDHYPDAKLLKIYEKEVEKKYSEHGFSVKFLDADGLIYNGGAFHCVALQIPD